MNTTKILSRDHSSTRFEIYQTDYNLWLRCHVCGLWLTGTKVNFGWIEIEGCECEERRIEVNDMLRGGGITAVKYDTRGVPRDQYLQFIKNITAPHFPLEDLHNGKDVEDVPFLYQWIAFWTGNDVLELELDFSVPQ